MRMNVSYRLDEKDVSCHRGFEELLKKEDKIKVSQLYREDFEITTPETRIVEVAAMMIFKDISRVFVISEDNLVKLLQFFHLNGNPLVCEPVEWI